MAACLTQTPSAAAGPQQASIKLLPGRRLALINIMPGITMARSEEMVSERVGLALMNPRRRLLEELYPAWANPACWTSPEELKAKYRL